MSLLGGALLVEVFACKLLLFDLFPGFLELFDLIHRWWCLIDLLFVWKRDSYLHHKGPFPCFLLK